MNKNLVALIIIIVVATILYLISGYSQKTQTPTACTMEAKICPDGSAVSRTGPNCQFTPCPGT